MRAPIFFLLLAASLVAHSAPRRKVSRKAPIARPKPAHLSPEELRGQIAYIQNDDLWVVNPDTRQKHLLFPHDVTMRIPNRAPKLTYLANDFAFSPDLKNLVANVRDNGPDEENFNERRGPRSNGTVLYVFPLDGSAPRALTGNNFNSKFDPRWSPDGKHIAFTQQGNGNYIVENVHIVDADGTNDHRVVGNSGDGDSRLASKPFWSTNSQRLMFDFKPHTPIEGWNNGVFSYDVAPVTMTAAMDGSNQQPFNGDWENFDRPDVARDAGLHAQIASNRNGTSNSIEWNSGRNSVLRIPIGSGKPSLGNHEVFRLTNPICPDSSAKRIAFGGSLPSATVNAQGFVQARLGIQSIFVATGSNSNKDQVRLLVANAQLLDWL